MYTTIDMIYDNVDGMKIFYWTALLFTSYIVGLTVIGELKDMMLCKIAIERLGDKLGPWWYPIVIGVFLRRTFFLPLMLGTAGVLVVGKLLGEGQIRNKFATQTPYTIK
jgi:hypothetical protein